MALDLGTLRASIEVSTEGAAAQIENFKNKYQSSLKDIEKSQKSLTQLATDLGKTGKDLTKKLTVPILALGTACVKLGSDLEETQSKSDQVFKDMAGTVNSWADSSVERMGIARQTALDMASTFGDMATSMGLTTGVSADLSMNLVQLAADLSSFKNISVERANSALTGVFTGEGEALKSLGIIMNDATLSQYAMNQGIKTSYSNMTQAEKVQLRYNYVMSQTANAQGDFARTGDGVANSSRKLKEQIKDLGAKMGQVLLPVVSKVLGALNNFLTALGGIDSNTLSLIATIAGIVAAVGPVLMAVSKTITAIQGLSAAMTALNISTGGVIAIIGLAATAIAGLVGLFTSSSKGAEDTANNMDDLATSADEATTAVNGTSDALGNLTSADAEVEVTADTSSGKTTLNSFLEEVNTATGQSYGFTFEVDSDAVSIIQNFADILGAGAKNSRELRASVKNLKTSIEEYGEAQKEANNAQAASNILMLASQYNSGAISVEKYTAAVAEQRANLDILNGTIDTSTAAGIKLAQALSNGASNSEIASLAAEYATTTYLGYSDSMVTAADSVRALVKAQSDAKTGAIDTTQQQAANASAAASKYNDEYNTALEDAATANDELATALTSINEAEAAETDAVKATAAGVQEKTDAWNTYLDNREAGMSDEANFALLEQQYSKEIVESIKTDLDEKYNYALQHGMKLQDLRAFQNREAQTAQQEANTAIADIQTKYDGERQAAQETFYSKMNEIGATFDQESLQTLKQWYLDQGDTDSAGWIERVAAWGKQAATLNSENAANFVDIGNQSINGWIEGLNNRENDLMTTARTLAAKVKETIQSSLDIHSPSRYFRDIIGKNIIKGWQIGLTDEAPNLLKSLKNITSQFKVGSSVALVNATNATFNSRESSRARATNNTITQNNTFTSKELTPYEQRMELRKLDRDLAGVFA